MTVIPNPAAHELVNLLTAVRPDWQPGDIEQAVYDPICRARGFARTAWAFLWVALDPSTHSPRRALAPGPWWDTPNQPPAPTRRYVAEQRPAPRSEATRQLIEETREVLQRRSSSVIVNTDGQRRGHDD